MGLLLLLAITAISCVGVLVWTLQSVIGTSDQIVSEQVAEQEKISGLSRQFTYINSQVLTHVMTTNSVTMDTLSEKIFAGYCRYGTADRGIRRPAFRGR